MGDARIAAAGHRVLALSLPGHGNSASADSYAQEDLADWLASVLKALGLDRATVIGNSIGVLLGLHLTLRVTRTWWSGWCSSTAPALVAW